MVDEKIAELSVLYEIASFDFPGSLEKLFETLTEKVSRIFGVRRLALVPNTGTSSRSFTWGFSRRSSISAEDYVRQNRSSAEAFVRELSNHANSYTLYLEKKGGFTAGEVRLLHILSRRLVEVVELYQSQEEARRAHECLRLVVENSPMVAMFGFSRDGGITQWNLEAERVFGIGRPADSTNAKVLFNSIEPFDLLDRILPEVWETGKPTHPLEWLLKRGSDEYWLLMTLIPVLGSSRVTEVFCMAVDITTRKQGEKLLLQKSLELEAVFTALPDSYFRFGPDGTVLDYKAGVASGLLLSPKLFLGQRLQEVFPSDPGPRLLHAVEQVLQSKSMVSTEFSLTIGGNQQFLEARFLPLLDDQVIGVVRNITERKQAEERLRYLSIHDSLTGLNNRSYFEEEMHRIERSRDRSVGLIMFDVDGLKLVNDSLGHSVGDNLLKGFADILKSCFRAEDAVSRIGGDEFAVLLPNVTEVVIERACGKVAAAIAHYNQLHSDLPLSVSIGYAVSDAPPFSMTDLFKKADNEMYREKLHRTQSARSAIVQTLKKALEARDFITEGHCDRMQQLMTMLAGALKLPEHAQADLRLLAQFHDIGKVGIPDRILFKKGPLNQPELLEMRRHCEIGHRIAISSPDLAPIADWILKHHEWWNGQGYPLGLKGEEIPLECRILAIADTYDAMTSSRPYRKPISKKEALEELVRCAGTQLDPALVQEFVNALGKCTVALRSEIICEYPETPACKSGTHQAPSPGRVLHGAHIKIGAD